MREINARKKEKEMVKFGEMKQAQKNLKHLVEFREEYSIQNEYNVAKEISRY